VFSARGTTHRDRHLMMDLRDMMPHSKPESKMEKKDPVYVINEVRLAPQILTNLQNSHQHFL
jgi:ribosome biogenesis protein BRX1